MFQIHLQSRRIPKDFPKTNSKKTCNIFWQKERLRVGIVGMGCSFGGVGWGCGLTMIEYG